jgi:hypothetical protein
MPPEPLIPKASELDRTADVPPPPVLESPKRPDAGAVPDRPKRSGGPTVPELPRLPDVPTVPTAAKPAADKPAAEKGPNLGPAPMDAAPPRPAK